MGVSVVRRLGSRVSLYCLGTRRFRLRQGTALADDARVVHAPQWPVAGLRMGVRRRQSAGTRLGCLARLQSRNETARRRRPEISRTNIPKALAKFHLVGESQGYRRP